MALLTVDDFSGYLYLQTKQATSKERLDNYIEFTEPKLFVDLLGADGYELYMQNALIEDYTDFEDKVKPCFARLMWFEYVQELQTQISTNGMISIELENAKMLINEIMLRKVHNEGVRLWNELIDWLSSQSTVLLYDKKYKTNINAFGV
jgi:hypothetical protein